MGQPLPGGVRCGWDQNGFVALFDMVCPIVVDCLREKGELMERRTPCSGSRSGVKQYGFRQEPAGCRPALTPILSSGCAKSDVAHQNAIC